MSREVNHHSTVSPWRKRIDSQRLLTECGEEAGLELAGKSKGVADDAEMRDEVIMIPGFPYEKTGRELTPSFPKKLIKLISVRREGACSQSEPFGMRTKTVMRRAVINYKKSSQICVGFCPT
jgi:hypothetical protein